MTELNIEKFNPTRAELVILADKYKGLTISGVDDKAGYESVDRARKDLVHVRNNIVKTGKMLRAEAISFQRTVLDKERELVGIIEPIENQLTLEQTRIDNEKILVKLRALTPERMAQLKEIELEVVPEMLEELDEQQFESFFLRKKSEWLDTKAIKQRQHEEAEKERIQQEELKIQTEKTRLAEERRKIEWDKERAKDIEAAKVKAAAQATRDAEEKAKREKEEEAVIAKKAIEEAKLTQERLEKRKKYQAWLKKHKYSDNGDFYIGRNANVLVMYKKIDEFKL